MILGTINSEKIELSSEAILTSGSAILAMRGAGKSWLASIIAEELASERLPFVIIDPEGEYWTLKVEYPDVIIAGGEHADIPLAESVVDILAQISIKERLELVLDLSDFKRPVQIAIVSAYLSELFFIETEYRIPFWVCLEEADIWVPQTGNPSCKTHVLDICQRGRKRGIGFALVSQRPALVDKTALSQAEFRFFKRFQQPHDLRAVRDYLGEFSSDTEILPSLSASEVLLYAPSYLKKPKRFVVANRRCPHGGATPDQLARIKTTSTSLQLKSKLQDLIKKKNVEVGELEKRDQKISKLKNEIESLKEEIEKIRLAKEVAGIISESKLIDTTEVTTLEKTDDYYEKSSDETNDAIHELIIDPVNIDTTYYLGPISIDIGSGAVQGTEISSLLLDRLNSQERAIFLTLLVRNTSLSSNQISIVTNLTQSRVRLILKQLMKHGLIKKDGRSKRGNLYTIKTGIIAK